MQRYFFFPNYSFFNKKYSAATIQQCIGSSPVGNTIEQLPPLGMGH